MPDHVRGAALDFGPMTAAEQIRWALRYMRRRYSGSGWTAWHTTPARPEREHTMGKHETVLMAPANPYRNTGGMAGEYASLGLAPGGPFPRRHDTEAGPGLTGSDLHLILTQHHRDGYAQAEREFEARLDAMRGELAEAFDRGYTAGKVERAQGLAGDFRARLFELHFRLQAAEEAKTKAKIADALGGVRSAWDDLMQFVENIRGVPEAAAAVERAGEVR
jgi:hypothetical protein